MSKSTSKLALYYIHSHGSGHLSRAKALIGNTKLSFSVIFVVSDDTLAIRVRQSFPHNDVLVLHSKYPSDYKADERSYDAAFEGVPLAKSACARVLSFIRMLDKFKPSLFISDVSAELTIIARSAGVPIIMMRHSGNTDIDPTQTFAYECASALYAPYPRCIEKEAFSHFEKTRYLGFTSSLTTATNDQKDLMSIVSEDNEWAKSLADTLVNLHFSVEIYGCSGRSDDNINFCGRVENVVEKLNSQIVFCHSGNNILGELLSLRKTIISTPLERPYDEQMWKAVRLDELGYITLFKYDDSSNKMQLRKTIRTAIQKPKYDPTPLFGNNHRQQFLNLVEEHL